MEGWQRAFVLHSRPWSETSLMLDVFTENRVACVWLPRRTL
ncbi:DNA repair protein [Escherichia coli]|uniref:DNA repair protein n=1 Tax=Escherichia coli TaxID=562 RepID=A0A377C8E9_ECOLX|nr:DNA repair protein [Escherichia coli]